MGRDCTRRVIRWIRHRHQWFWPLELLPGSFTWASANPTDTAQLLLGAPRMPRNCICIQTWWIFHFPLYPIRSCNVFLIRSINMILTIHTNQLFIIFVVMVMFLLAFRHSFPDIKKWRNISISTTYNTRECPSVASARCSGYSSIASIASARRSGCSSIASVASARRSGCSSIASIASAQHNFIQILAKVNFDITMWEWDEWWQWVNKTKDWPSLQKWP